MPFQDLDPKLDDNDIEDDSVGASQGGADQSAEIVEDGKPWRDENGILTYETFGEFEADKDNIGKPAPTGQLVRVVDGAPNYADSNFFWVVFSPSEAEGETTFKSLAATNKQRIEAGGKPFVPPGAVQIDELQGVPIFQADPKSSNEKPGTNTGKTVSKSTGVTTTTTTSKSNSTTTKTESTTDTENTSTKTDKDVISKTKTDSKVSPKTVSRTDPVATKSTGNAYVYEPIRPGFDRYDFNLGKKVFTPDTGGSLQTYAGSNEPTPPAKVAESNKTAIDGGIAVGTTTGGPSLLRQRQDRERDPNRVGPQ